MNNKNPHSGQLIEALVAYATEPSATDNPLKTVRSADAQVGAVTAQQRSKNAPEYQILQRKGEALVDLYRACVAVVDSKLPLTQQDEKELEHYVGRALRGIDASLRATLKGYEEQHTRSRTVQSVYNVEFCTMTPEGYIPVTIDPTNEETFHAMRMELNKAAAASRGYYSAIRTLFEGKARVDFHRVKRTPEEAKAFKQRVDYYFNKLIEPSQ